MINQFQLFLVAQLDSLIDLRLQAIVRMLYNPQQEIVRGCVQYLTNFHQCFNAWNRMIVFYI